MQGKKKLNVKLFNNKVNNLDPISACGEYMSIPESNNNILEMSEMFDLPNTPAVEKQTKKLQVFDFDFEENEGLKHRQSFELDQAFEGMVERGEQDRLSDNFRNIPPKETRSKTKTGLEKTFNRYSKYISILTNNH